jgi:hypothetical protein
MVETVGADPALRRRLLTTVAVLLLTALSAWAERCPEPNVGRPPW